MPEFVTVTRHAIDLYNVTADSKAPFTPLLFAGNAEQTHNWLGRHDYKLVTFAPGSWLAGTYKRPKEVKHAA